MEKAPRSVRAVPRFLKSKKRLPEAVQAAADAAIRDIMTNPLAGEPKMGALRGVRVVKFKAPQRQYLLGYFFHAKPDVVELIDVAVHENFYKRLENYLEGR